MKMFPCALNENELPELREACFLPELLIGVGICLGAQDKDS